MNNEKKIQLYGCIKRQFTDPGLYKSSRIYDWLYTNGYSLEKLGYASFKDLCGDIPEVFMFQEDPDSEFILVKAWHEGDNNLSDGCPHPADNFFGTKNIILNDDIIEMTQQSLYALTKILSSNLTVQQMKQVVFECFDEAKQSDKLDFSGEKYVFPIDYCADGQLVNGIITKNLNSCGKSLYFSFEKTRISRGFIEKKQPVIIEIPEEEKKHIYSLLIGNFPLNQQLHMAAVSKFLTDRGVDRTRFGYYKMKDFLSKLDFLEMREIILGGVPQYLVTIKCDDPSAVNLLSDSSGRSCRKDGIYFEHKIPNGELKEFCSLPAKPLTILEDYIEKSGQQDSFCSLEDVLSEDFNDARKNGAVNFYGGKLVFPCRYKKNDGSNVELILKPSAYDGKAWFLYYVDTIVREGKDPSEQLESFAYLGNRQTVLGELADLAYKEEWDFKNSSHKSYYILNQYLKFTFSRIMREKKLRISSDNKLAAFNTGLTDKRYDDIFAYFVPNEASNPKWKLAGFCTAFSDIFGKKLADTFDPLPSAPAYFTCNDDMLFNFNRCLNLNYERLLFDNIGRFPLSFLRDQLYDNFEAAAIVDRLRAEYGRSERLRLFEQLKSAISSDSKLASRLQNNLKSAVEFAKKRAGKNYKIAVPSFIPPRDSIALMLPLSFTAETVPDAALVLEITKSGSYQAQTILSLSQAYINARLVNCLTSDWLMTSRINSAENEISTKN